MAQNQYAAAAAAAATLQSSDLQQLEVQPGKFATTVGGILVEQMLGTGRDFPAKTVLRGSWVRSVVDLPFEVHNQRPTRADTWFCPTGCC